MSDSIATISDQELEAELARRREVKDDVARPRLRTQSPEYMTSLSLLCWQCLEEREEGDDDSDTHHYI